MTPPPRTPPLRLRAFRPVPLRARCDGWTPFRQAEFVGKLAETGSVSAAAAFVGMARETAYRLRRRPEAGEFALMWDVALAIAARRRRRSGAPKPFAGPPADCDWMVTVAPSWRPEVAGLWRPMLRRGSYVGCAFKPDKSIRCSGTKALASAYAARRRALAAGPSSRPHSGDHA